MEHDIGSKIKAARIEKKLTQEQVAELLGVSRQTISNWENAKSYPDIISVIKMSECYDVSLDYLLKGKEKMKNYPFPSVSYELAQQIREKGGYDVRVTVPGHTQRGGSPCPYDRVFASRLGSEAGKLILNGEYGFMVGIKNREIIKVPLEEVAGKLKMVSPDASIVQEAKMLGICFGD